MDSQKAQMLLKLLSAQNVNVGTEWITCSCPLAPWTHDSGTDSNPSFGIKISPNGESMYNCYTCGYGDLMDLVHKLSSFKAPSPKYKIKEAAQLIAHELESTVEVFIKDWGTPLESSTEIVPWPEEYLDQFLRAVNVPLALQYLSHRGFENPETLCVQLQLHFDVSRKILVFPYYNKEGNLVGCRGRYIQPQEGQPRYHLYKYNDHQNKLVWYGEDWINTSKTVYMVESVFDVASVLRVEPNVIAPMTVGISKAKAQRMSSVFDIVTLFDHGTGGNRAREIIDKYFTDAVIQHTFPPHTEIGMDGKPADDAGNMTVEQIKKIICN